MSIRYSIYDFYSSVQQAAQKDDLYSLICNLKSVYSENTV